MNKIEHIVAENISYYRSKRGLTQSELGELCSVEYGTIQRWEKAKTWPKPDHVQLICDALKINPGELYRDRVNNITPNLPEVFQFLTNNHELVRMMAALPEGHLDMYRDIVEQEYNALRDKQEDARQA